MLKIVVDTFEEKVGIAKCITTALTGIYVNIFFNIHRRKKICNIIIEPLHKKQTD